MDLQQKHGEGLQAVLVTSTSRASQYRQQSLWGVVRKGEEGWGVRSRQRDSQPFHYRYYPR